MKIAAFFLLAALCSATARPRKPATSASATTGKAHEEGSGMKALCVLALLCTAVSPAFGGKPDPADFPLTVTVGEPGILLTMSKWGCVWALDCVVEGSLNISGDTVMIACPIGSSPQLRPGTYRARYSGKVKWEWEAPADEHMRITISKDIQILVFSDKGKPKVAEYWVVLSSNPDAS